MVIKQGYIQIMDSFQEYIKMAKRENLSEFKFTNTTGIQKSYTKDERGIFRHKLLGGATTKRKIENVQESIKTKKLERRVKRDLGGFGGSIHEKIRGYIQVPLLTNATIRQAVQDYRISGERKSTVISTYGHISNWDVSRVTDMYELFSYATPFSFNEPLNNWNVSNVTNMTGMFHNATSFNQPLDNWNFSKVRNAKNMFKNARSFNQPLNDWNVSNVRDMKYMFYDATSFNQPLDKWNASNRANMRSMFLGASSFNQPLHAPWYDPYR